MSGIHFRYAWISRPKLQQLFVSSSEISKIRMLLKAKQDINIKCWSMNSLNTESNCTLQLVIAWFHQPNWLNPPKAKQIRNAFRLADQRHDHELLTMLNWVADAVRMVVESKAHQGPSYGEAVSFLKNCCNTDFPVLLSWRNLRLALQIFEIGATEKIRLRKKYLQHHRPTIQATNACIGYALAGEARLSPRQAWVGAGFATINCSNEFVSIPIKSTDEVIRVEPDLAWFNRNWLDLEDLTMGAGILPWDYLQQRISVQTNPTVRIKYQAVLNDLLKRKKIFDDKAWNFKDVTTFIYETEKILSSTVNEQQWQQDRHQWWITRLLTREQQIPNTLLQRCESVRSKKNQYLVAKGLAKSNKSKEGDLVNAPYPQRVLINHNEWVIATAEEYVDWLIKIPEGKTDFPLPELTKNNSSLTGDAYRLVDSRISYLYTDPNPRRCAERFAVYYDTVPAYISTSQSQKDYIALQPPDNLVDNRLVRLSEKEVSFTKVRGNKNAGFNSTLICEQTLPIIQKEMSSPSYKLTADLVPVFFSKQRANISAGQFCEENQCWVFLKENHQSKLNKDLSGKQLALIYFLEIEPLLGKPDWLELIVDGKRTGMPVHSMLVWEYLSHLIRTAKSSVVINHGNAMIPCNPVFVDEDGSAISTFIMINQ